MVRYRYLKGIAVSYHFFFYYFQCIAGRKKIDSEIPYKVYIIFYKLQEVSMKITKFTKALLDFMLWAGILAAFSLPVSLKILGDYFPEYRRYYLPLLVFLFLSGIFAVLIIRELRSMFRTVLASDCFVEKNVTSLKRMSVYSFCIAGLTVIRLFLAMTPAAMVEVLVFLIAGLFSRVLADVFDQAVTYKLENDLTI